MAICQVYLEDKYAGPSRYAIQHTGGVLAEVSFDAFGVRGNGRNQVTAPRLILIHPNARTRQHLRPLRRQLPAGALAWPSALLGAAASCSADCSCCPRSCNETPRTVRQPPAS